MPTEPKQCYTLGLKALKMISLMSLIFQAVAYVHSRFPSSALVAVSEGSGSGTLLSYLGESGSSSYLTAAAAISPVLLGQRWFEMDMPPIYRWLVMFQQKMRLRR